MTDENLDFFDELYNAVKKNNQPVNELINSLLSLEDEIKNSYKEIDNLEMQRIVLYCIILYKMGCVDDEEEISGE